MVYIPKQGEQFTEETLQNKFDVRNAGGIRPSNKNKAIILIKSYFAETQGGYKDEIDEKNGIIIHIGHGEDDQSLRYFNKSLAESKEKEYTLLYFEKLEKNNLVFLHRAEYVSHEFATEKNSRGEERTVIKFKLKIIDSDLD